VLPDIKTCFLSIVDAIPAGRMLRDTWGTAWYDSRRAKEGTMTASETITAYMDAWNETDPAKRASLLGQCWSDAGAYTDPMADVQGREALSGLIDGFHKQMPGASIVTSTGLDQHHNRVRFGWKLLMEDGSERMEGIDIAVLADDGRLASITGFWGVTPPPPQP
jgi:hypothetical protein